MKKYKQFTTVTNGKDTSQLTIYFDDNDNVIIHHFGNNYKKILNNIIGLSKDEIIDYFKIKFDCTCYPYQAC